MEKKGRGSVRFGFAVQSARCRPRASRNMDQQASGGRSRSISFGLYFAGGLERRQTVNETVDTGSI